MARETNSINSRSKPKSKCETDAIFQTRRDNIVDDGPKRVRAGYDVVKIGKIGEVLFSARILPKARNRQSYRGHTNMKG